MARHKHQWLRGRRETKKVVKGETATRHEVPLTTFFARHATRHGVYARSLLYAHTTPDQRGLTPLQ